MCNADISHLFIRSIEDNVSKFSPSRHHSTATNQQTVNYFFDLIGASLQSLHSKTRRFEEETAFATSTLNKHNSPCTSKSHITPVIVVDECLILVLRRSSKAAAYCHRSERVVVDVISNRQ